MTPTTNGKFEVRLGAFGLDLVVDLTRGGRTRFKRCW